MVNKKRKFNDLSTVLDIGHHKIRALFADIEADGRVRILSSAILPVPFSERGMVSNMESTIKLVYEVLLELVRGFDYDIRSLDVAVGGEAMHCVSTLEKMRLSHGVFSQKSFNSWLKNIINKHKNNNWDCFKSIYYNFIIDNNKITNYPIAKEASIIQGDFHLMFIEKWFAKYMRTVLDRVGVELDLMLPASLTSSYAATTEEERIHGVCHIDIGEKNSSFCIWYKGFPILSGALNQGGEKITQKIAEHFFITHQTAQWLKNEYGSLLCCESDKTVSLLSSGTVSNKKVDLQSLSMICERMMHQFFMAFAPQLNKVHDRKLLRNLVLSGGGAQLSGMREFIYDRYKIHARIVNPKNTKFPWLVDFPEDLQEDSGIITALGMLKLYYQPLPYQDWDKVKKAGIMDKLEKIFF